MSFDGMDGKNRKILAFESLKLRKITVIFILGSLGPLLITLSNLYMGSRITFDYLSWYLE